MTITERRTGYGAMRVLLAVVAALLYAGVHYGIHAMFGDPTTFGAAAVLEASIGMALFAFIGYLAAPVIAR